MYKGDISNALPKRIIVVLDAFTNVEQRVRKVFGLIPVAEDEESYDRVILSHLYLYQGKTGYTLELASIDKTQKELNAIMEMLDEQGTNPFRYATAYKSVEHLVKELPYRPEVVGVLDLPARLLKYGHWGMDFTAI